MSTEKLDELNRYLEKDCLELSKEKRTHIWVLAHDAVYHAIPAYMGD